MRTRMRPRRTESGAGGVTAGQETSYRPDPVREALNRLPKALAEAFEAAILAAAAEEAGAPQPLGEPVDKVRKER